MSASASATAWCRSRESVRFAGSISAWSSTHSCVNIENAPLGSNTQPRPKLDHVWNGAIATRCGGFASAASSCV